MVPLTTSTSTLRFTPQAYLADLAVHEMQIMGKQGLANGVAFCNKDTTVAYRQQKG